MTVRNSMHVRVKVTTEANKEQILHEGDRFLVSVTEAPEHNEANYRVVQLIARHFHVPPSFVKIITGHRSPHKILEIRER